MSRIFGEIVNLLRPDSDNESEYEPPVPSGQTTGRTIQKYVYRDITERQPLFNTALVDEQQEWVDLGLEWDRMARMKNEEPVVYEGPHNPNQDLGTWEEVKENVVNDLKSIFGWFTPVVQKTPVETRLDPVPQSVQRKVTECESSDFQSSWRAIGHVIEPLPAKIDRTTRICPTASTSEESSDDHAITDGSPTSQVNKMESTQNNIVSIESLKPPFEISCSSNESQFSHENSPMWNQFSQLHSQEEIGGQELLKQQQKERLADSIENSTVTVTSKPLVAYYQPGASVPLQLEAVSGTSSIEERSFSTVERNLTLQTLGKSPSTERRYFKEESSLEGSFTPLAVSQDPSDIDAALAGRSSSKALSPVASSSKLPSPRTPPTSNPKVQPCGPSQRKTSSLHSQFNNVNLGKVGKKPTPKLPLTLASKGIRDVTPASIVMQLIQELRPHEPIAAEKIHQIYETHVEGVLEKKGPLGLFFKSRMVQVTQFELRDSPVTYEGKGKTKSLDLYTCIWIIQLVGDREFQMKAEGSPGAYSFRIPPTSSYSRDEWVSQIMRVLDAASLLRELKAQLRHPSHLNAANLSTKTKPI